MVEKLIDLCIIGMKNAPKILMSKLNLFGMHLINWEFVMKKARAKLVPVHGPFMPKLFIPINQYDLDISIILLILLMLIHYN